MGFTLETYKSRDVKGLHTLLEENQIKNFVGVHFPYEPPENPNIGLNTEKETIEKSVSKLVNFLEQKLNL